MYILLINVHAMWEEFYVYLSFDSDLLSTSTELHYLLLPVMPFDLIWPDQPRIFIYWEFKKCYLLDAADGGGIENLTGIPFN